MEFDWDMVSAIGTCVGSAATFITIIIAIWPYLKKGKLYFTAFSNVYGSAVLTIVNSKNQGMIIEKIEFVAGLCIFKKLFFVDNFLECEDDLVSEKNCENSNYIDPYSVKKIKLNSTRIIYYIQHVGVKLGLFKKCRMRIIVHTNYGKIKIKTKYTVNDFIQSMLVYSKAYSHLTVDSLISWR